MCKAAANHPHKHKTLRLDFTSGRKSVPACGGPAAALRPCSSPALDQDPSERAGSKIRPLFHQDPNSKKIELSLRCDQNLFHHVLHNPAEDKLPSAETVPRVLHMKDGRHLRGGQLNHFQSRSGCCVSGGSRCVAVEELMKIGVTRRRRLINTAHTSSASLYLVAVQEGGAVWVCRPAC